MLFHFIKQQPYCMTCHQDQYVIFRIFCGLCSFQFLGWKSTCKWWYGVLRPLERNWQSASQAVAWCWLLQRTLLHLWTQTWERHVVGNCALMPAALDCSPKILLWTHTFWYCTWSLFFCKTVLAWLVQIWCTFAMHKPHVL